MMIAVSANFRADFDLFSDIFYRRTL